MIRRWLSCSLIVIGVVGGVGLWRFPLILRSGTANLRVGPDSFVHDAYLSIPAGLPVAGLAVVGLALLALPGNRKHAGERHGT